MRQPSAELLLLYSWLPAVLFPVLLSLYRDEEQFQRVAPRGIVSTWSLWAEYEEALDIMHDVQTVADVAIDAAAILARSSLQDIIVHGKSDAARRREISATGRRRGVGFDSIRTRASHIPSYKRRQERGIKQGSTTYSKQA